MSELTDLLAKIDQEAEAMRRALHEPAIVSRHDVINQKMKAFTDIQRELTKHVGTEKATTIIGQAYYKAMEL